MKIGIVTTWTERGASYVSKQIMDTLKAQNEVFIYARGGEQYEKGNLVWDSEIVYWGKKTYSPYSTTIHKKDFLKWVNKNKLDTIIFNEQRDWESVLLLKELGIKVGTYVDYYTEETLPFFKVYDFVICNTKRHFNLFSEHENPIYIPWGTDINLYHPHETGGSRELTFFHSSGVSPYRKGTDLLISAFYKLSHSHPRAKLLIHTQINLYKAFEKDERRLKELRELIISENLKVVNKTVTAPGLYYKGDIYVYPSRLDGLGLTVAEALACGLPVITSNQAPMNEFVIESYNGNLIKIDKTYSRKDGYYWPQVDVDIDSLTKTMNHYMNNPKLISKMKSRARLYAEENLDWEKNSRNLSDIIGNTKKINLEKNLHNEIINYQLKMFPLKKIFLGEKLLYLIKKIIKKNN